MIVDPVERGGAEDRVRLLTRRQTCSISEDELNLSAEARTQKIARDPQHVRRQIDSNRAAVRKTLEDLRSQPAGSAADVEHRFVSLERESLEYRGAPIELRRGDVMVGAGIPLAHTQTRIAP